MWEKKRKEKGKRNQSEEEKIIVLEESSKRKQQTENDGGRKQKRKLIQEVCGGGSSITHLDPGSTKRPHGPSKSSMMDCLLRSINCEGLFRCSRGGPVGLVERFCGQRSSQNICCF